MLRRCAFVILMILALVANPVTAAAAQASCSMTGSSSMAGMASSKTAHAATDPCCDRGSKEQGPKACADACANLCAVAAAVPTASVHQPAMATKTTLLPAITSMTLAFDRNLLDPPPKSNA